MALATKTGLPSFLVEETLLWDACCWSNRSTRAVLCCGRHAGAVKAAGRRAPPPSETGSRTLGRSQVEAVSTGARQPGVAAGW